MNALLSLGLLAMLVIWVGYSACGSSCKAILLDLAMVDSDLVSTTTWQDLEGHQLTVRLQNRTTKPIQVDRVDCKAGRAGESRRTFEPLEVIPVGGWFELSSPGFLTLAKYRCIVTARVSTGTSAAARGTL